MNVFFHTQSGGDLENAEHLINVVPTLISLSDKLKQDEEPYQKISGDLNFFFYNIHFVFI